MTSPRCNSRPFGFALLDCLSIAVERRLLAGLLLPALHDNVDIFRIEFDAVADPLCELSGSERHAAAEKRVMNEFATPKVILWAVAALRGFDISADIFLLSYQGNRAEAVRDTL